MATVWLARDLKHDRMVAIKLLRPELAIPVGADRFAREIGIVAKLNHPNILGVIDSGIVQADGLSAPYYVMPHVEGPSLSALLAQGEKLEINEALRLAAEVADALAFAHSRGVVHRDVKPGNILIQAGHALVADFGVAIALDAATAGGRHQTLAGEVLGTPVYMSPEQASGELRPDGRSDVYSLGCVLYEMLSGDPPFMGNTPQAMIVAHLSTPPPPLAARRPDLPPGVAAAVHRALEKLPADRYANAGEFRDALERLRTSIVVRGRWWPMAALLVVVAALFWWSTGRRETRNTPGSETVVLLSGFRDRSGTLRAEGAALDDALRLELQQVPGIRVIDVGDQPEMPVDTLRARYRADWLVRGSLDRIGDSVGATVRVVDAGTGTEVRSGVLREPSPSSIQAAATAVGQGSLFATVRYALDSVLLDRWLLDLGADSATTEMSQRARMITRRATDALTSVGPRRMLEELAVADSLLAVAAAKNPRSAQAAYSRAALGNETGYALIAAHQYFPDSTWLPSPMDAFQRALPFASEAVQRAPESPDARFLRAKLYGWLLNVTADPAWRDSSLADLRKASTLAGGRADIWARRAAVENAAGLWTDARFSAEQGQAVDFLHTNAETLLLRKSEAELKLGHRDSAQAGCRSGARQFPGNSYFIDCEATVLGRLSSDPADAERVLALADSLTRRGTGDLSPIVPDQLGLLAVAILARAKLADSAGRQYDRVVSRWRGAVDPILLLDAAYARQALGDLDSALTIVARVVREDPGSGSGVERDPWYEPLRRQPGFPAAMKGIPPSEAGSPGVRP